MSNYSPCKSSCMGGRGGGTFVVEFQLIDMETGDWQFTTDAAISSAHLLI